MPDTSNLNILPETGLRPVSRRGFLKSCAACAACAACGSAVPSAAAREAPAVPADKAKVRVVFTHPRADLEGWPYINYNYQPRKEQFLARLGKALPNTEFMPVTVMKADETRDLLANDSGIDGYVCLLMGIPSAGAARQLLTAGRPVVLVDDLYGGTGEFLGTYARARAEKLKVVGVSSTRFEDVVQAVRLYEVMRKLRVSTILDVCERTNRNEPKAIEEIFGTAVRTTGAEEINEAYQKADKAEAEKYAAAWVKNAKKVVEPSREEIGRSGLMYIAMRDMMAGRKAQAVDMDCLRLFYGKKLPAYPCLGFCQLNDDGLVGACEADLQSTITMLAMTYLAGRPGYISDPVIDTSKNQIIYAHCVAPTKVWGPKGQSNPYLIRDHSEDRKGAVVQSLMPIGEMTTTLKFHPVRKEVIIHQARTVANIDEDRACRTKLAAEVKDINKLLGEWNRFGWHRVTFYGDLREPLKELAAALKFRFVEEA